MWVHKFWAPGHSATVAAKFCMVVPKNFSMIIAVFTSYTKVFISSNTEQ
jgi:hypothetical protein